MLELVCDKRLYNTSRYYLAERGEGVMQKLSENIQKCAVFLLAETKGGKKLFGTGFFIGVSILDGQRSVPYLVTAKHVLVKIEEYSTDKKVYIRINTNDGSSIILSSDLSQWVYHPTDTSVDTAVLQWAPDINQFDYMQIPTSMAVTEKVIEDEEIGAGDEVFMTGLFSSHHGEKKNLPIIRTGNIALMPEEKVYTNSFGMIDAYLIEARSIGGISGSPVFAYLGEVRAIKGQMQAGGRERLFCWLGLMHGHWDIDENKIDSDDTVTNEVGRSVNMGIGIVIPATKILEIIDSEDFMESRKKLEEAVRKETAPVEDSMGDLTETEFKNTLKKVARKTTSKPDQSKPKT